MSEHAAGEAGDVLEVRGGVGGTGARIEDLRATAAVLGACAQGLLDAAAVVGRTVVDPGLVASAVRAPMSLAATEQALLAAGPGRRGALPAALRLRALSAALVAAAAGYLVAEQAARRAIHQLHLASGVVAGELALLNTVGAVPRAVQGALIGAAAGAVAGSGSTGRDGDAADGAGPAGDPVGGAVSGAIGGFLAGPAGVALMLGTGGLTGPGDALGPGMPVLLAKHVAGLAAGLGDALDPAFDAVPGLLPGALAGPAGGAAVGAALEAVLGGPAHPGVLLAPGMPSGSGVRWPPSSSADVSALLLALAGTVGLLRDPARVRTSPGVPRPVPPPTGVADLTALVAAAYPEGGSRPGSVSVTRLDRTGGGRSWVVAVPGTQVWAPRAGSNPMDLTSDARSLAGRPSAAAAAVVEAMRVAGVRPGEPVCLVGHSLGGMVAAGVAADPAVRAAFAVREVVALGAPLATYEVPPDVGVLAIEHLDDLVPRLDGGANPDRSTWVTVRRELTPPGAVPDVAVSHEVEQYVRTAALVDGSGEPSLVAARGRLAAFLDSPGTTATQIDVVAVRPTGAR